MKGKHDIRRVLLSAICILAASVLIPSVASAVEPVPADASPAPVENKVLPPPPASQRPPMTSDRPLHTLQSGLVGKWVFQFENGFDFASVWQGGKHYLLYTTPTKIRVGVHDRIELFVYTDAFATMIALGDYPDEFGFADAAAGVKMNFARGGGWAGFEPMITLHVSLSFPIGTTGFTLKTYVPKAIISFHWKVPGDLIVAGNIGSQMLMTTDKKRYFEGIYGASVQRPWTPLTERVGNFLEAYGALAFSPEARTTVNINGGFYFNVDEHFRVDLAARAGLYGETPGVAGTVGVTIRL